MVLGVTFFGTEGDHFFSFAERVKGVDGSKLVNHCNEVLHPRSDQGDARQCCYRTGSVAYCKGLRQKGASHASIIDSLSLLGEAAAS